MEPSKEFCSVPEYVTTPNENVAIRDREEVRTPRRYLVLLHNDHYTTMEFVVEVLRDVFHKSTDDAVRVMLNVHEQGMGVAGVYVKSVAETKIRTVHKRARDEGFPLKCSMEPE
jgi:ATP-dependent Clp protease adaptor protein ClpS